MIRFRIRTLLIVVTVTATGLGAVVAHYQRQAQAIAEFMQRDVYIYAEYDGPSSLRWLLKGSGILVRPMQAQVLLQPADENNVRFFGKVQPIDHVGDGLREMQRELNGRLGLQSFQLVIGPQRFPDRLWAKIGDLQIEPSESRLWFWVTPCGFSNFPQSRGFPEYAAQAALPEPTGGDQQ